MKLTKARVQNYRSIRDTGEFDIEELKTILVGPNEAGKSAILQALQQINRPEGVSGFDSLRDYPRKLLNKMDQGEIEPKDVKVATVWFDISDELTALPPTLQDGDLQYERTVYLDNHSTYSIVGAADPLIFSDVEADLLRLAKHLDQQTTHEEGEEPPSAKLKTLVDGWQAYFSITAELAQNLEAWLQDAIPLVEEGNEAEEKRLSKLRASLRGPIEKAEALALLNDRVPKLVLFSNYFRVRPIIHLAKLAQRIATDALEDETYDYGNLCLLKLLGLEADELSKLGKAGFNAQGQLVELDTFRDELDKRDYRLNSASIMLTDSIREVWNPNPNRAEADRLRA